MHREWELQTERKDILESFKKFVILFLVMAHTQRVEVGCNATWSQGQNADIGSTELVPEGIGKGFLGGFIWAPEFKSRYETRVSYSTS